jgi:DNA primase large subunit
LIRFGNKDFARYPFLKEALSYVTRNDFRLEDLDNPDYRHLISKAQKKIHNFVFDGKIEYLIDYEKTHDTIVQEEVIVFLISLLIIKSISIESVTKKYALQESMRFEKYLIADLNNVNQKDPTVRDILYKIFNELFGTEILLERNIYNFFKIRVNDYLDHSIAFQEREWNLINRTVDKGFVYLDGTEIVRLFRNEINLLIIDRIKKMNSTNIPHIITSISISFKSRWEKMYPSLRTVSMNSITPPCIEHIYDLIKKGENLPHPARVLLATFLIYTNRSFDEMLNLFKRLPDYNEQITRYQLEHLAGKRGNSKRYFVPSCEKVKLNNLCFETKVCRGITNPSQLVNRKKYESS